MTRDAAGLQAGSGYYNRNVAKAYLKAGVWFSITAKMSPALLRVVQAVPKER